MAKESPTLAAEALKSMKKKHLEANIFHFGAVIGACRSEWSLALTLLREAVEQTLQVDQISYNGTIRCSPWLVALRILDLMEEEMVWPNVISFNAAIAACEKAMQWHQALALLDDMPSRSLQPNSVTYNSAITACDKSQQWQTALHLLGTMPCRDVISYNAAISACSRSHQWTQSLQLLKSLEEEEEEALEADEVSYGAALRSSSSECFALDVLERIERRRLELNLIVWNSALSACAGNWPMVLSMLQQHEADAQSFTLALTACGTSSAWEAALAVLEQMPQRQVEVDDICFNSALHAVSSGRWDVALHMLQATDHVVDVVGYSACIRECPWEIAMWLFESMLDQRLQTDLVAFGAALGACERSGRWEQALSFLGSMPHRQHMPNTMCFNVALSACEKSSQWAVALQLLGTLGTADLVSFNAAISACEKAGMWQQALELWERLPQAHLEPDLITYNALISSCESQWPLALYFFEELQSSSSLVPDEVTLNSVMSVWPSWRDVLGLLQEMQMRDLRPDVISFGIAMDRAPWDWALELLKEMRDTAVKANSIVYTSAVLACERDDQQLKGVELLWEMRREHIVTQRRRASFGAWPP
ncbi:unnamed protein product [Durusdinium trenchii]